MSNVMKKIDFEDMVIKLADRTANIIGTLNLLLWAWGFDLESRHPGVAYVDEQGIPVTDLDLACFLMALVERRAVISLPHYTARRAATVTEGERVTSKENRHGRIAGLTSNQEVFSFGILVDDANVAVQHEDGSEDVGAFRNFMIQDLDGTWHPGWDVIEIKPFGIDKAVFDILTNATKTLKFRHFISPLRWTSFYGRPHLLAILALMRLEDEQTYLRAEAKRIREILEIQPKVWPKSAKVGESVPQKFLAFEVELDGFCFKGEYEPYPPTQEGLDQIIAKQKRYRQFQTQLRFQARATQFAFVKEALIKNVPEDQLLAWLTGSGAQEPRKPAWVSEKSWERGYKASPKARTYWARMEIQPGLFLRFRAWFKTEQVAA
jgi:hypothetical protein